jgi:hypothetical protein
MIRFRCPRCASELQAEQRFAGGRSTCPACGGEAEVPDAAPVPLAEPVAPPTPSPPPTSLSPETLREARRTVGRRADRGLPLRPVRDRLLEEGADQPTAAAAVIAKGVGAYRRAGWRNVLLGILAVVLGIVASVLLSLVLSGMTRLYVLGGVLVFGGGLFCRGIYQLYRAATASLEPKQRTRYL